MPRPRTSLLLLTGIAAFTTAAGLAQGAPPALQATPPGKAQTAPGSAPTLKANAQLVVVDVVVTDSKQAPVHNLKASDFTVQENGARQQVTGFEEHVTMPPSQAGKIAPMRPLPPGIFTNYTPVPEGSAVNVLLLDALNTQMKDQSYVLDQLREYLKNAPAGTRIAIFGLNNHLILLQGFTTDLALLKSVVEKTTTSSSPLIADAVGNGGAIAASDQIAAVSGADMGQVVASMQKFEAMIGLDDLQLRVKTTLDAMTQLAQFMAGIPGRKNLIWFSGSFPVDFSPQSEGQYRDTMNLLARSRVAVYPVGAHGLATNATAIGNDVGGSSLGIGVARTQAQFAQNNASQNIAMNRMAADTGGHAYVDTNGLSEAVGKAIDNGSNYYTLSYTPTDSKADGEFRKIQVKLAQQGLTLTYRNGYFADAPVTRKPSQVQVSLPGVAYAHGSDAVAAPAPASPLATAMMRGAPPATGILLKLQVRPASSAVENALAAGNIVSPEPAAKQEVAGPFRRYAIDIAADARDIQITPTPDGHYQFSAEVLTFVYDANGAVINTSALKARGNLSPSTYANMSHTGLPFHQEISVPEAGEYYLRTSVHDLATGRYGAVEIPVASVAKLAPVTGPEPGH